MKTPTMEKIASKIYFQFAYHKFFIFYRSLTHSLIFFVSLYSRASKSTPKYELKASERLVQWNTRLLGINMRVHHRQTTWSRNGIKLLAHTNPKTHESDFRFFFCFAVHGNGTFISTHTYYLSQNPPPTHPKTKK